MAGLSTGFYNREVIERMVWGEECEFAETLTFTVVSPCPVVLHLPEFKRIEKMESSSISQKEKGMGK